jgi:predicted RNA-binding protein with PUA-like domain
MVDVKLESILPRALPLDELRTMPKLTAMELLRKGSRLSVQPVRKTEFDAILAAAKKPAPPAKS